MPSDGAGTIKPPNDTVVTGSAPNDLGGTPPKGGGFKSWSKGKQYGVVGGVFAIIGLGVYLYEKHKSAAAATTASTAATTGNQPVAETPLYDGQGTGTGGGSGGGYSGTGSNNFSNSLASDFSNQDAAIAAAIATLNTSGQGAQQSQGAQGPASSGTGGTSLSGGQSSQAQTTTSTGGSSNPTIYTDLSPNQAQQLVSSGAASPAQALSYEVPAASETPAERHQQEVANKSLRAQLK